MENRQPVKSRSSERQAVVDHIIVGQGIAGTVLAFRLLEAGRTVRVYDIADEMSSSRVAAGIINPVTGRKMVKTWMIDELLPEFTGLYRRMEKLLGIRCLEEIAIQKLFSSTKEQNDWMVRRQSPEYEPYLSDIFFPEWEGIRCEHGAGTILRGHWLDIRRLVDAYGHWLLRENLLVRERFETGELVFPGSGFPGSGGVRYRDCSARTVIFCSGYTGREHPFFEGLPLLPAKGEILDVRCNLPGEAPGILNRNGFLLPIGPGKYRIGATIKPWDLTPDPTAEARAELEEKFRAFSDLPYEVTDHQAAFRPTVKDRRPLLGQSRLRPEVYLFNGLGTKGASLAPWCSKHLAAQLETGRPLPAEVDVWRFES